MTAFALEAKGLTRRFGAVAAVEELDLRIRTGEVFGFLGPNGAGKTTTIRMMAGLLRPSAGRIEVLGEEVGPSNAKARLLVGLCPQENVLYPELTASENLEYAAALYGVARRLRRARAEAILTRLGLAEKANERAEKLSGGMKRRLTLGLALVHDPPVIILDEPEAGLDPQTRVAMREFVRGLAKEKTVVLTSHNMDEVDRLADRVAVIDRGRLVAEGTSAELKARLGDGDNLEITVADGAAPRVASALEAAALGKVRVEDRTVVLHGHALAKRFPVVLERVHATGAEVVDVRYRGNTLEDVFIALTGRGLRE